MGARVLFQPELHIDSATKKRTLAFLDGMTVKEAVQNDVVKE